MFRDTRQHVRACRALLATLGLENLSTFEGPTSEAIELLRANGGHLSSSETILLQAAFDFWNGKGDCTLGRMLHILDLERLEPIVSLAMAVNDVADSSAAVDRWLARHERASLRAIE